MEAVYLLGYQEKPNYIKLKQLFTKQLKAIGCHGDGRDTLDWISSSKVCCPHMMKGGKGRFSTQSLPQKFEDVYISSILVYRLVRRERLVVRMKLKTSVVK